MRIDSQVEPLVREALGAAVARDPERSAEAAKALAARGDSDFQYGISLCLAVDSFKLLDLHGGWPGEERITFLAEGFARMEAWAEIEQSTAEAFLAALAEQRDPTSVLPPEVAVRTAFVVGGWLLSAFPPEEQSWEDALDQVLNALEAQPDSRLQ
ncbi:hypothetical protein GCM10022223_05650 [Kineosporia mesophila]|uniref:TetR family transcriptional regulator n=1 Tax=Kineosporia mesophila TaxID=566012 RepID=A0ABP6Z372_9ACTN|nr:hypothetical protein [Kineosporia mesophila]MCD5355232.1 hypothetical protein [Kineosporia mesophila]